MAWQISGRSLELCSCKMLCPCWLGPDGEPDEGWCAAVFGFQVQAGQSDGVDLSGTTVVLAADWPGNFFGGDGTARLTIDAAASDEQRRELEGIFSGQRGGHLEGLWGAVFETWLPTRFGAVEITWGASPRITVEGYGQAALQPLTNGAGQATQVTGSVTQAGLAIEAMDLASAKGSRWADPEVRSWRGDSGTLHAFDWSA
ncbi:MAG: DUF1326 domain-containing protein [Pseudomonadota bacterium]